MNRIILISLLFTMLLTSCANKSDVKTDLIDEPLTSIHINSPILVTSLGQSIDYVILEGILDNLEMDYTLLPTATLDEIKQYNTIIAVVGSSNKGLKYSGITLEEELSRIQDINSKNTLDELNIILIHMGGKNRRGAISDEIIETSLKLADSIVVVDDGDFDNIFSNYADKHNVKYKHVLTLNDLQEYIQVISE